MRILTLAFAAILVTAIPACTPQPGTTSSTPLAQAITTAQGAIDMLAGTGTAAPPGLIKAVAAIDPTLIPATAVPEIMGKLEAGSRLLATLSAATPPAQTATTLRQVEGYINAALSVLGEASQTSPATAQYALLIDAVAAASQIVEQFVNQQFPTARLVVDKRVIDMRAGAMRRGMTEAKAVAILRKGR